jgi:DNA-binding IclR family transcriptional regulator
MSKEGSRYSVPNLERALVILEVLAQHPEGLNLTNITSKLSIPQNAAFRITHTLVNHGFLHRDPDSKVFTITKKMLSLGQCAVAHEHIIEYALPHMRELRDNVNGTVYLGTLLDNEGVIIEQAPGGHPFKIFVDLGTRFQLHCSAPGKAILAYLPDVERDALLDKVKYMKFNERTPGKRDLKKELNNVRELGYGIDRAEQFEGVHCIGAPIFDSTGYPVAAIWISSPSVGMPEKDFPKRGRQVKQTAMDISTRLGYALMSKDPLSESIMK